MSTPSVPSEDEPKRLAKRYVGVAPTILLVVVLASVTLVLLGAMMTFWPSGSDATKSATYLGIELNDLTRDQSLLLIVSVSGALGAMGHVLRSFYRYVGERKLVWSWVPSYLLIPVVGAVLATIVYVVLRAGLMPNLSASANDFGFVAVALLSGMFSSQAAEKLKEVFETLFTRTQPGTDALEPKLAITGFEPTKGTAGTTLLITGAGLEDVDTVEFGGRATSNAEYDPDNGTLSTVVPEGAATGQLSVRIGETEARSATEFEVEP